MPKLSFVIRDALPADISACIELDHTYETEHVWQMTTSQDGTSQQFNFRTERLPRSIDVTPAIDEVRLRLALELEACYLVAAGQDEEKLMLGYLIMRVDAVHKIALIQNMVVGRKFRRRGIGKRLLSVARRWGLENGAWRLHIELRTKNYPAIQFCLDNGLVFCGFNDQYFPDQDIAVFFGQSLH